MNPAGSAAALPPLGRRAGATVYLNVYDLLQQASAGPRSGPSSSQGQLPAAAAATAAAAVRLVPSPARRPPACLPAA